MLKTYQAYTNTLLWFSAGDNGAHTAQDDTQKRPSGQLSASNGLRQCKASLFEGGIRVGGFIQWPSVIKKHTETYHAAVTNDLLPTILDIIGVKHPHPDWYSDGMSLLPLLTGDLPASAHRSKPIGFAQGNQVAWLNETASHGVWKIVYKPEKGQCDVFLPPYGNMKNKDGPFLFNLTADPTESLDLCEKEAQRCADMKAAMQDFVKSIDHSRVKESQCAAADPLPERASGPSLTSGFRIEVKAGKAVPGECLTIQTLEHHAVVVIGSCDAGSKWIDMDGHLSILADPSMCLKVDALDPEDFCEAGSTIWMGPCAAKEAHRFSLDSVGRLTTDSCPGLCAVPSTRPEVFVYSSAAIALGDCSSPDAFVFAKNTGSDDTIVL
jgi:hypothetical protein